jgi:translocation and assembly module TamA
MVATIRGTLPENVAGFDAPWNPFASTARPSRRRRLPWPTALLCACLVLIPAIACAQLDEQLKGLLPGVLQEALFGPKAYRMELRGDMDSVIRVVLESVSETLALQDRPPATPEMLDRRARSDIPLMQRALRSEGYYDGKVEARVDHTASPPLVVFEIRTGPPYLLSAVHFQGPLLDHDLPEPTSATAGLTLDQRARAPDIEQGSAKLAAYLRENGHPFSSVELGEVIVDHAARSMTVQYGFDPGPKVLFGPILIKGQERVLTEYIMDKVPWTRGQIYQASLLNTLRGRLMRDGLFTVVNVSPSDAPLPAMSATNESSGKQELPVTISVVERVPRTVKAGLAYETDTGLGTVLDWEHRNLRGQAQRLTARLVLAEKEQGLSSDYRVPNFLDEHQSLEFSSEIGQQQTGAYDKKGISVGAAIVRQLSPVWTASLGARYRLSDTTQFEETQTYGLFSTPGELLWEMRDDLLNPTRGWRALIRAEPYIDTLEPETRFFKLFGGLSVFVPLLPEDRMVLAARGAMGSIMGQATRNLPPDERFYAGGGGSIRGYAYQSIGPEENDRVVGGRSIVESSMELRLRMENNFGLVAFLDGGQVFSQSRLQWEDDFFWGAGLGLRYFTDFAPIRLDVAFPLNRRDRDDAFQVYVSIGQAF